MSTAWPTHLGLLLDAGAAHDAEYGGGLSNHRPMALLALARLGADAPRLRAFDATYSARLQPTPAHTPWPAGDAWAAHLGRRDAWPLYRDLFLNWLHSEDAGDVLRQVLPLLVQGCGGAAFHGLIRTAYAVQAAHRQELADALAYWACRWLPLGDTHFEGRSDDAQALLRQLPVVPSDERLIFQRMQAAAAQPRCQQVVQQLRVGPGTLQQLAQLAAVAYAGSGNFTALHLLTSAHALRVLQPWLVVSSDDPADGDAGVWPKPALRAYWCAFAAAVCVAGLQVAPPVPLRSWAVLQAQACASDDDHVIKLVDSCREQQRAYGGKVWRQAASRALGVA
jgi:hypothetical protein